MTEASAAIPLAAGGTGDGGRGGKGDTVLMRPELGLYAVAAPLGATPGAARFAFGALSAALDGRAGELGTEDLRAVILDAQDQWESRAGADASLRGFGCRLAVVVLRSDHLIVAHMGDCGALLIRHADVIEATRDHTARSEPTRHHPRGRRLILRAFGMQSNPEIRRWSLEAGDRVVLVAEVRACIPDHEIAGVTSSSIRADDVVSVLVARALERGATGEVSAIAVFREGAVG